MTNAASTSNPSVTVNVNEANQNPSHVIGPNFVTVKLSGKSQYNLWRIQMECLIKSQHMVNFIKGAENGKGKVGDIDAWMASDSLVKGWILGSLSEEVARKAVNHLIHMQKKTDFTAKDLWDDLQRSYETKLPTIQARSEIEVISVSEDMVKGFLYDYIIEGDTKYAIKTLKRESLEPWDKLTNNGNTVLHVAVGSSTKNHELLKTLLEMTPTENTLLDLVNSDGSTLLHVAAIGGNMEVVDMLVERNPELLSAKDKEGHMPLVLSISNMHTKTSHRLFVHMKEKGYEALFSGQSGEELVVLAISSQDFSLAEMIINENPDAILDDSDAVLTTLAQNFPRELNFWERRVDVEDVEDFMDEVVEITQLHSYRLERFAEYFNGALGSELLTKLLFYFIFGFYAIVTAFGLFLKAIVHPFMKDKSQVYKDAESLLHTVCKRIYKDNSSSNYHKYYNSSIFEATRRNSSTFIRIIIRWFPDAIWSINEDGHNFIQYSVINRSEKIYNLVYEMSEHKNIYKTIKDSSGNTLLLLAARLAPINKLNLISGAALQIQRELQWFKEVERFVCPLTWIQKNLDDETPQEVFTREHKDLVIDGENWIKKTAESYTITAALIITIVFAAAITVPGGNQDSGIPILTNKIAFTLFAISNAISLFTAVTSLLLFLSILTARFADQDFLFKLPTKLIIGLTMLFLSTTAMIIAFGATLFLVFGQSNSPMLIPIGALTCLPITSFVTLQCPLIVELITATYGGGIFGREKAGYFY